MQMLSALLVRDQDSVVSLEEPTSKAGPGEKDRKPSCGYSRSPVPATPAPRLPGSEERHLGPRLCSHGSWMPHGHVHQTTVLSKSPQAPNKDETPSFPFHVSWML